MLTATQPQECHTLLAQAFNARDIKSVLALFAEDAILTDQDGNEHVGLEAIAKAEQRVIDLKPDFHIETIGVTEYGDIAVLRSKWHLKGTTPSGEVIEMAHNGIEIVQRQSDGSWLYIIDNPFYAD